jgi:protocatechuate 3,4-dioxygenase beta subunit
VRAGSHESEGARRLLSVTPRLAVVLVLAGPVAALAQQAPLAIQGRVFAADNRVSLPRARVTVTVDGASEPPAYTDDRGEFSIAAPPAPTFTLTVVKAGYAAMQVPLQRAALAAEAARELAIALTRSAAINGRIVDLTGETVVGARVYADRLDADASAQTRLKFSAITDDRGEYRVGGLPPGRYSVTAADAQDPGAVATLDLRPGDDIPGIDFTIKASRDSAVTSSPQPRETPETATIRGRVLSATGRPIEWAVVHLTGSMPPRQFVTDARGRFTFTGLAPGDYEVRASRGDFLPALPQQATSESASRIAVAAGARVDNLTLTLSRGLAVTGTIVDRAGEPLQGVSVQALQLVTSGGRRRAVVASAQVGGIRQTDDKGRYRVLGLQPGTYVIAALADAASFGSGVTGSQAVPIYFPGSASIADALTVTITAVEVEGIDFALADVPVARVTGVALDSTGVPIDGTITLAVSHRSGSIVPSARTVRSGPDGAFAFVNVAPGDYVVRVVKFPLIRLPLDPLVDPLVDPMAVREFDAQYVTVGAVDAEPLQLRTARGSDMNVRVVIDSPVPDDPSGRMQIEAYPVDPDRSGSSSSMRPLAEGRFRLAELTGPLRVVVSGMPDGWYLKTVTVDGADMTDQVIDGVDAGRTIEVEIEVSARGGSIAGRVRTESRRRFSGALVVVFPQDREKWYERSRFVKAVNLSRDGAFRAASLPPGDYYVAVTAAAPPAEASAEDALDRLLPQAARVTLKEAEARRVNIEWR